MSYRVSVFTAAIPTPLTKRDILMFWEALPQSSLLVQSLVFPTERMRTVQVPVGGVMVEMPTGVYESGDRTFEVPDNIYTTVRYELWRAYMERRLYDIPLLMGNPLDSLNLSDGVSFEVSLSSILKGVGSAVSGSLLTGCVLCRSFIKSIDDVTFTNQGGSSDAVIWRVTVHYGYVSKLSFKD